jgi:hypothetical protein
MKCIPFPRGEKVYTFCPTRWPLREPFIGLQGRIRGDVSPSFIQNDVVFLSFTSPEIKKEIDYFLLR